MALDQLNTELYQRMYAEQEKYKAWLLSLSPEAMLNHAYEYANLLWLSLLLPLTNVL